MLTLLAELTGVKQPIRHTLMAGVRKESFLSSLGFEMCPCSVVSVPLGSLGCIIVSTTAVSSTDVAAIVDGTEEYL